MNIKILTTVCAALYAASIGASVVQSTDSNNHKLQSAELINHKNKSFESFVRPKLSEKIKLVEGLRGTHNYIVRLKDAPIASYQGAISGYPATSPTYSHSFQQRKSLAKGRNAAQKRKSLKLDFNKVEVKNYTKYLVDQQNKFINEAAHLLSKQITPLAQMKTAFNGMIVQLTQSQAIKIAKLPALLMWKKKNC